MHFDATTNSTSPFVPIPIAGTAGSWWRSALWPPDIAHDLLTMQLINKPVNVVAQPRNVIKHPTATQDFNSLKPTLSMQRNSWEEYVF